MTLAPVILTVPRPERQRVRYLTVRQRDTLDLVTVVELLSPVNKRPRGVGRRKYLAKREAVLQSSAHLIEIDLLRGGSRLPTLEPLPPADYYAFVHREQSRPKVEVYPWSLRQPLPTLPVPLAGDDLDARLDLTTAFTSVYDRAGYDYSLDYRHPVQPPVSELEAAWVQQVIAGR